MGLKWLMMALKQRISINIAPDGRREVKNKYDVLSGLQYESMRVTVRVTVLLLNMRSL